MIGFEITYDGVSLLINVLFLLKSVMKTFTRAPLNGNLCAEKGKLEILIRKLLKGTLMQI